MNAQEKNIDIAIAPYIDAQKSNLPIEAEQYMLNKLTSIVILIILFILRTGLGGSQHPRLFRLFWDYQDHPQFFPGYD